MGEMNRRDALRWIATAPVAVGFSLSVDRLWAAKAHVSEVASAGFDAYMPRFFSDHEWQTLHLLVDYIIPADERSGSATDAGVPEFVDFIMTDPEEADRTLEWRQTAMRGGLAWIDAECHRRFRKKFLDCDGDEQVALLDEIAFVDGGEMELNADPRDLRIVTPAHGRAFFNSLRDLTASGFWSSQMGVEDLQYQGNVPTEWNGPPPEVLRKLGLQS